MKNLIYLIVLFALSHSCLYGQQWETDGEQLVNAYFDAKTDLELRPEFVVSSDFINESSGIRSIHALQTHDQIYVREGMLTISFNQAGNKVINDEFQALNVNTNSPQISIEQAILSSMDFHGLKRPTNLALKIDHEQADLHQVFDREKIAASDIQARLMFIRYKKDEQLRLTWETQLHTRNQQHYWISYVDAVSGKILDTRDYVIHCEFGEGLVYDNSPESEKIRLQQQDEFYLKSAASWDKMVDKKKAKSETCEHHSHLATALAPMNTYMVLALPAEAPNDNTTNANQSILITDGDVLASPNGWTSNQNAGGATEFAHTQGNNAYAFHDPNVTPLGGTPNPATAAQATTSTASTGPSEFLYPWDLNKEPEVDSNRAAAIVNLFYWNNIIHDVFHYHGFTEAGRNFQFTNFSGNGLGNDEIYAQAQDGGGTNNANFLTLADGVNGQMQMYLWTSGILDSTIQMSSVNPAAPSVKDTDKFVGLQGALYNTASPPPTVDIFNNPVSGEFILVNAGCGSPEGCGAGGGVGAAPCNNVVGKIVLVDRGSCSFVEKVHGAQTGGAAGVIIMNNDQSNPDGVAAMGGTDPTVNTITIPAVMCSYNTGIKLKAALAGGSVLMGMLKQDNPIPPKRDGDFDNGIIAHEYGHGISTRTSPQSATGGTLSGDEQGGEGWADYYALWLTLTKSELGAPTGNHPNGVLPNHGIGTYVTYDVFEGAGIRPRTYSVDHGVNEYTFAGSTNGGFGVTHPQITIPHGIGFIWCTMLWEMTQAFIDEYGYYDSGATELDNKKYSPSATGTLTNRLDELINNNAGNSLALKLIQLGISLQPSSPRMTDMRDGIIKADSLLYDGFHSCLIMEAFAKRGLGFNTINPSNDLGDESDGYGTFPACNPSQVFFSIKKSASSTSLINSDTFEYYISVTNTSPTGSVATNVVVTDFLPAGATFIDAPGTPHTVSGNEVQLTIASLPADTIGVTLTLQVSIKLASASTLLANYNFDPNDAQGWLSVSGGANTFTLENDSTEAYSGESFYFCPNSGAGTSGPAYLQSPTLDTSLTNRQLRFWHHYDTDSGYDGGYIEYTLDNGLTWTRMALQVNPYTGDLNSTFNPTGAGAAFTGSAANYFESAGMIPDGAHQVRFAFSEDTGGGGGDGWWIDAVKIVLNPVTVENVASVTDPVSSGGRTHTSKENTLIFNTLCDEVNLLYNMGIITDGTRKYVKELITIAGDPQNVEIKNNSDVELNAGQQISIDKNFDLELGSELLLNIEDCNEQ